MSKIIIDECVLHNLLGLFIREDGIDYAFNEINQSSIKLKWIPCSERMPEENERVLVKDKYNDKFLVTIYYDENKDNDYFYRIIGTQQHIDHITHWMPLSFLEEIE